MTFGALTGATYAALVLLGAVVGLLGCFHFSLEVLEVPVGVVAAILVNFFMCWLGGLAMRSKLGAVLPGAGWMLAAWVFAVQRPEGDVVVGNSTVGLTFLFGGTVAAGVGIGLAPSAWMARHTRGAGTAEAGTDEAGTDEPGTDEAGTDKPDTDG